MELLVVKLIHNITMERLAKIYLQDVKLMMEQIVLLVMMTIKPIIMTTEILYVVTMKIKPDNGFKKVLQILLAKIRVKDHLYIQMILIVF